MQHTHPCCNCPKDNLTRCQMNVSDPPAHFKEERTMNLQKAPVKAFSIQCHSAQRERYRRDHLLAPDNCSRDLGIYSC